MKRGITKSILGILLQHRRMSQALLTSRIQREFLSGNSVSKNLQKKISQSLRYLQSRKMVSAQKRGLTEFIKLTDSGLRHIRSLPPHIVMNKPASWTGHWYILAFDIPLVLRRPAELFCRCIKSLDFYQLQKSLWAYPYPCEQELAALAEHFSIRPYVRIIRADRVEGDIALRRAFGLSG